MSFLAAYIMRGRMQAIILAASLAILSLLLPPISILSSATVALVTLRRGASEGLVVLLCSCIAAALLGVLLFSNYNFALLYGLVLWLPIWVIAVVLREGRYLSLTIEITILIGILAIIGFYIFSDNTGEIWQGLLTKMTQPILQDTANMPVEKIQQTLALLSHFMTGIVVSGMIYSMLFGLFLGRWWQSILYNPGGFREEYLKLRLTPKLGYLSLLVVLAACFGSRLITEIAINIGVLLFLLYTIIGTAVLHVLIARTKASRFLVPMLYITLAIIPHTMFLVAIYGLLDVWLDFRNKQSNRNGA